MSIEQIFQPMLAFFGPQNWWPAESRLEVAIGAILTQNTNWKNVEKAIENLRNHHLLDPHQLLSCSDESLHIHLKPSGYYRLKTTRLKSFLAWFVDLHNTDWHAIAAQPTAIIRKQLLEINGIGPETADSILLYALGSESFVVDAYTKRICVRHGWCSDTATYDDLKMMFENSLPVEAAVYNEMHALIVRVAKEFCLAKTARCDGCPLKEFLPTAGVILPSTDP